MRAWRRPRDLSAKRRVYSISDVGFAREEGPAAAPPLPPRAAIAASRAPPFPRVFQAPVVVPPPTRGVALRHRHRPHHLGRREYVRLCDEEHTPPFSTFTSGPVRAPALSERARYHLPLRSHHPSRLVNRSILVQGPLSVWILSAAGPMYAGGVYEGGGRTGLPCQVRADIFPSVLGRRKRRQQPRIPPGATGSAPTRPVCTTGFEMRSTKPASEATPVPPQVVSVFGDGQARSRQERAPPRRRRSDTRRIVGPARRCVDLKGRVPLRRLRVFCSEFLALSFPAPLGSPPRFTPADADLNRAAAVSRPLAPDPPRCGRRGRAHLRDCRRVGAGAARCGLGEYWPSRASASVPPVRDAAVRGLVRAGALAGRWPFLHPPAGAGRDRDATRRRVGAPALRRGCGRWRGARPRFAPPRALAAAPPAAASVTRPAAMMLTPAAPPARPKGVV